MFTIFSYNYNVRCVDVPISTTYTLNHLFNGIVPNIQIWRIMQISFVSLHTPLTLLQLAFFFNQF